MLTFCHDLRSGCNKGRVNSRACFRMLLGTVLSNPQSHRNGFYWGHQCSWTSANQQHAGPQYAAF